MRGRVSAVVKMAPVNKLAVIGIAIGIKGVAEDTARKVAKEAKVKKATLLIEETLVSPW